MKKIVKKTILLFRPFTIPLLKFLYWLNLDKKFLRTLRLYLLPTGCWLIKTAEWEKHKLKVNVCESVSGDLYFGVENTYGRELALIMPHVKGIVVDVGANIGLTTLKFSEKTI